MKQSTHRFGMFGYNNVFLFFSRSTYKNPFRKRRKIKSRPFGHNDEAHDKMKAMNSVGNIILRRPFVSAKYPHKLDEQIIPINETALKRPFSTALKFKSHFD